MVCGVYLLKSNKTDKVYIGSSVCIEKRYEGHMKLLNQGKHHVKALQKHYYEDTPEIKFEILKRCKSDDLGKYETEMILQYNAVSAGFNTMHVANRPLKKLRFLNSSGAVIRKRFKKFLHLEHDISRFTIDFTGLCSKNMYILKNNLMKFPAYLEYLCLEYPTGFWKVSPFNYSITGQSIPAIKRKMKEKVLCSLVENESRNLNFLPDLYKNLSTTLTPVELDYIWKHLPIQDKSLTPVA